MKIPAINISDAAQSSFNDSSGNNSGISSRNHSQLACEWSEELISKYDVAGPRYTSYPSAIHFSESFTADVYRHEASKGVRDSLAPLSLYIHIPFCENICYYCACNKVVTSDKTVARKYIDYLIKEIKIQSELMGSHRIVTQLHFGGGTPTFLEGAEFTELMHQLAMHYNLTDSMQREYSVEIDPRTVNSDTLALLKGLGFNRLSLGVQDFDARVQEAINRRQDVDMIQSLTKDAWLYQFKSVSYDLIYGLPFQTLTTLEETLAKTIELFPDRVAFYNYAHLPERFTSQRAIGRHSLPSAQQKVDMLLLIADKLLGAGYVHIGMDHFVKPQDDLAIAQKQGRLQRNFQGYSTSMATDLVGLGVSSISTMKKSFAQNERDLTNYYQRLDNDELPISKGFRLSKDDELRGVIIGELICNLKVDFKVLEDQFSISFSDYFCRELKCLISLEMDGLVCWHDVTLNVTEKGRVVLRNICMIFDKYLQTDKSGDRFSKAL